MAAAAVAPPTRVRRRRQVHGGALPTGGARQMKVELVGQGDGTGPVESRTINRWPVDFFLERDERGLRAMAKAT